MNKRIAVLLLIIFAFGVALRIYRLNAGLHYDEIRTVIYFAEKPLSYIVTHYRIPNNHILHSILVHISMWLFGESQITIRLPAFLMGILSIPLIYKVAKELFDEKVGLVSAFLLSISVYHIMWSQLARGYSGLVFFSLLSLLFLMKAIKRGRKRYWVGFILATVLNIYNIPLGLIVLGIEISFFLVIFTYSSPLRADVKLLKRFLLSVGIGLLIIFLLYLPVLSQVLHWSATRGASYPRKFNLLTFKDLFSWLSFFSARQTALGLYLLFFFVGVFASLRKYKQAILLSLFWTSSLFVTAYFLPSWPRIYIYILPIYLITVSKGFTSIGMLFGRLAKFSRLHTAAESVVICILALALFGGISLRPLRKHYKYYSSPGEDWRGIAQYLKSHAKPYDKIHGDPPVKYYLRGTALATEKTFESPLEDYFTIWHIIPLWERNQDARSFCKKSGFALVKTFQGHSNTEVWVLKVPAGEKLKSDKGRGE